MWTGSLLYPPSLLYSPPCPYHHNHFSGAITTFKVSEQKIIFGNKPECIAIILATHRQLPSWLTKPTFQDRWNFLVLLCRSSRPNSRPARAPKPFRRLTNLLGMSQETWAISWGIYVFTDGYVCPSVCFTLIDSTGSWELFLSVLRDSVICEQASSGKELCLSSREQQKRWNQKSYNPPMESNVDAAIPIGYITLSNLLFVFF